MGLISIFILLTSANYKAQGNEHFYTPSQATIFLESGTVIYSEDSQFNKQILERTLTLKNSNVSFHDNINQKYSLKVVGRQSIVLKESLSRQLTTSHEKKQIGTLKKIQKEIKKFKERNENLKNLAFNLSPFSNHFFSSGTRSEFYSIQRQNTHDFSKLYIGSDIYKVTKALDCLYSEIERLCSGTSVNLCYTECFSVRPPPQIL